jgi:hypothetical protein
LEELIQQKDDTIKGLEKETEMIVKQINVSLAEYEPKVLESLAVLEASGKK